MEGLVFKSTGSWYKVQAEDGIFYDCRLKGKLKLSKTGATNPVAVGDRVVLELEDGQAGQGVISEIRDRDNYIIRKSVHKTGQAHILASNIDQLVVIASLTLPRTSLGFIDRLLVSAESYGIPARVVFNKVDLLSEEEKEYVGILADMYTSIGYPALVTSVVDDLNIGEFNQLLSGKTSLLSGHSGVGKSTLVNTIAPDLRLSTQEISLFANKGKHTTTYAEMFRLDENTLIIDTPGIKELGLMEMEEDQLSHYFPEMRSYSQHCKFYNCTHRHEPGCAVLQALDEGKLPLTRYDSYLSMVENDDNRR
ncbi:MAG TPA: ribosome small subunit-dependent GTPase A [Catalimonadaceae bacterium]|nr:ribosome small subunit-dependent GTPase A [Catalimonadaceae bacterium]